MNVLQMQDWSYLPDVPEDVGPIRDLLQGYAHIPVNEIDRQLLQIRERAWKLARLPFIGRWKFLNLMDPRDPRYQQALFRLKLPNSADALLELGCCLGQALRQFRLDGAKGPQLFGLDIQPGFVDMGFDLFRDRDNLGATFVVGDVLNLDSARMSQLEGRITMVHADSFFHLFDWTQQVCVGRRIVSFLKPGTRNAMIFGRQAGVLPSKHRSPPSEQASSRYLHNAQSFQALWDTIGAITDTRWSVQVEEDGEALPSMPGVEKGIVPINFTVHQLPPAPAARGFARGWQLHQRRMDGAKPTSKPGHH